VDAARSDSVLDATTLKVFLTPHPDGFFVLCAPAIPGEADDLTAEHVERVLELLAEEFRYVIVDTGSGLDEATLVALQMSTDLVLVAAPDVPSVRAAQKEVDVLAVLAGPHQRRHFVLNRADERAGLSVADIEATVGMLVDVSVPSSRAVPLSVNQGSPLVASDPRSSVSRALVKLVNRFADQTVSRQTTASGGWFRWKSS
jgi:pilus assembly protein CpaE